MQIETKGSFVSKITENLQYLPLVTFSLAFLKSLFLGFTWVDVAVLAVLGSISSFFIYQIQSKRMRVNEARFDAIDKHLTELYKKAEEVKNHTTGMKFGENLKARGGF